MTDYIIQNSLEEKRKDLFEGDTFRDCYKPTEGHKPHLCDVQIGEAEINVYVYGEVKEVAEEVRVHEVSSSRATYIGNTVALKESKASKDVDTNSWAADLSEAEGAKEVKNEIYIDARKTQSEQ